MKFNKTAALVIINILSFLFLIICLDYIVYIKYFKQYNDPYVSHWLSNYKFRYDEYSYKGIEERLADKDFNFRHIQLKNDEDAFKNLPEPNENLKDILLFGCSFTYGSGLDKNDETFNYKLAAYSKRNVYNFGIPGAGAQHMLHLLKNESFYDYYLQDADPEYAVYTFIPSHLTRLHFNVFPNPLFITGFNLIYKLKKDKLENVSIPLFLSFLGRSYLIKEILCFFDYKFEYSKENKYMLFENLNEILLESRRLLQEKYPDIKFVILKMNYEDAVDEELELPFIRSVFESEGFIYLDSKELAGRKFKKYSSDTVSDTDEHPSSSAWDILVPKTAEKLNL